jgi:hypothetical protein
LKTFFSYIEKLSWNYKVYRYWQSKEKTNTDNNISLKDKLWLWKNGFNSFCKSKYGLTKENAHLYLDTFRYKKNQPKYNGLFFRVIDNKALLPFLLPKKLVCENYFIFDNGIFIGGNVQTEGSIDKYLIEEVKKRPFIYKPVFSSLGTGVIDLTEENIKRVLGFTRLKKKTVIISEKLRNLPYSDHIFSGCTNTIRINLMRDPATNKLFLLDAKHKIGTEKSAPVDNWSKGGVLFYIDTKTGVIRGGLQKVNNETISISRHPDSNFMITGTKIPNWNEAISDLLNELDKMAWLRYTGLDAVLSEDGFKIIELNSLPDIEALQSRIPVFNDPRTRSFFESAGVYPKKKF